jgi:hypothetical protein
MHRINSQGFGIATKTAKIYMRTEVASFFDSLWMSCSGSRSRLMRFWVLVQTTKILTHSPNMCAQVEEFCITTSTIDINKQE